MSRKPSEELQKSFDSMLRISHIFGFNMPSGHDFNPRVIFLLSTGIVESAMHTNGLYNSWPNVAYICNLMVISCMILQLLSRLASVFIRKDNERIRQLMKTVIVYYEREEENHVHKSILSANVKFLDRLLNGYVVGNFILNWIANPAAWIVSWYTGEFLLASPAYLPFTDPHTLSGYIINTSLHIYYATILYVCFTAGDVFYMTFIYQSIPMVEIFCTKLRTFGSEIVKVKTEKIINPEPSTSNDVKRKTSTAFRKAQEVEKSQEIAKTEHQMIVLIKEFNSYNQYLEETLGYLEFTAFTGMTLYSMGIAMSTVVTLYYSKAIGGVFVVFLSIQVLIPCLLGTILSHQKQKLLNELYGFQWYELSLSKQKMFLQFIHLVQNSNEYRVLVIGDLNMELFTNIMNGAYSYFTYLLNFVKL